jgi:tartrate dehydrogenase/decarboxylase / D-malate dehydrogenase
MAAVERVLADARFHTPDLGGAATTETVTQAVIDAVRAGNA